MSYHILEEEKWENALKYVKTDTLVIEGIPVSDIETESDTNLEEKSEDEDTVVSEIDYFCISTVILSTISFVAAIIITT